MGELCRTPLPLPSLANGPTPPPLPSTSQIKKVAKVYVKPRVKYTWVERETWLDEIIAVARANYGGGDGGRGGPLPELVPKGKVHRQELLDDQKKRGESWSAKRLKEAQEFEMKIFSPDQTLKQVQANLFKKGYDA